MKTEEIITMAIASIAEELGTDVHRVKVIRFQEINEMQEESE